jgi:hypothetical protein
MYTCDAVTISSVDVKWAKSRTGCIEFKSVKTSHKTSSKQK